MLSHCACTTSKEYPVCYYTMQESAHTLVPFPCTVQRLLCRGHVCHQMLWSVRANRLSVALTVHMPWGLEEGCVQAQSCASLMT